MQEIFYAKVIIVGDGGVGKSTMLYRYKEGKFKEDTEMTYGVDFMIKELEIDNYKIILQIWDFGGQDQFQFLHENRVLGIKGAIFMFDLSRLGTLERIDEWVSLCRRSDPNIPILFVGSKSDLLDRKLANDDLIKEMMEKYDFFAYIEISSKTGKNIHLIFTQIIKKIIENNKKINN